MSARRPEPERSAFGHRHVEGPRTLAARPAWRRMAVTLLAAIPLACMAAATQAADGHALLMWAGNYGGPPLDLPGIDQDAERAQRIARLMGIPDKRQHVLKEATLTQLGIEGALRKLEDEVRPGDHVFIYFSGHGAQIDGSRFGSTCSEGLVTPEGALYLDIAVQYALQRLVAKAAQVVMMNDSCHSGGAATKHFSPDDDAVPKAYPGELRSVAGDTGPQGESRCGQVVNKAFDPAAALSRPGANGHWVYLAAAAANEAAFATPRGSRATRAWLECLSNPALRADANGDGFISGIELQTCAQPQVSLMGRKRQTLSIEGEAEVPVAPRPSVR